MSKKLLIIGYGNHQFVYNYVKWLKKKGDFSRIDILTYDRINDQHKKYYSKIYNAKRIGNIYKIVKLLKGFRRVYRFFFYRRLVNKLPDYDYIHFHYLGLDSTYITSLMENQTKILTIWGSDYYRASTIMKEKLKIACLKADIITFSNELTKQKFQYEFDWNYNNLKTLRFGLAPLEVLEKFRETRIESKEKLGWDKDKIAITIGYNLSREQQHIEILQQIINLEKYSDNIELILPITYAGDNFYKEELISILKKQKSSYKYYDEFLDDITISRLRNASDVMIQLQNTDQFSGSMQEHLFTRNVVITGSWLPYQTIDDEGVYYIKIDTISNLNNILPDVIENYSEFYNKTTENPGVILELSSWEKNISDWLTLYN